MPPDRLTPFTFRAPWSSEGNGDVEPAATGGLPVAGEADVHLRMELRPQP